MSVFFNSNGFLSFIYLGPAYMQKYKYVTKMVNNGPGDPDSNHGFVLGSANTRIREKEEEKIELNVFDENEGKEIEKRARTVSNMPYFELFAIFCA